MKRRKNYRMVYLGMVSIMRGIAFQYTQGMIDRDEAIQRFLRLIPAER